MIDNKEAELLIKDKLSAEKEITPEKTPEKSIERISQEKSIERPKEEIQKEPTKKIKKTIDKDSFLKQSQGFLNTNNINIINTNNIKKGLEIDFIIEIQTSIGNLKYFCKAKNKKKINEADLSSALIHAQSKNLPLLFLTNGTLTKKTNEMLKNEFKNIIIKNI